MLAHLLIYTLSPFKLYVSLSVITDPSRGLASTQEHHCAQKNLSTQGQKQTGTYPVTLGLAGTSQGAALKRTVKPSILTETGQKGRLATHNFQKGLLTQ